MTTSGSPSDDTAWLRARYEAAEILTWGGLPGLPKEPKPLPAEWADVTDVVLEALARVRAAEDRACSKRAADDESPMS